MARSSGLLVHAWTFRSDPGRLPLDYGVDPLLEYERFFKEGVDAVFSDYPQHALQALKKYQREGER
jgi:glycerophosphoryl diester phosphodiesterase